MWFVHLVVTLPTYKIVFRIERKPGCWPVVSLSCYAPDGDEE